MAALPKDCRPRSFPPPEFPPRRPKLFARTPPAIFPSILGLLGLGLALRQGVAAVGVPGGLVEAALGAVLALWVFAVVAVMVKVWRRWGVLAEDMRVLPGRTGLAAATIGGMAAGAVLVPYAPMVALWVVVASLAADGVMAVLLVVVLAGMPPEGRQVNPGMHLAFVGFIVAAVPLAQLGYFGAAVVLFWLTLPVAVVIWGVSLWQVVRFVPPAPLRPMLAIHLAPAALFSTVAGLTGQAELALGFAVLGAVILAVLVGAGRWVLAAGFTPFWGAMTFPLAAYAAAVLPLAEVPVLVLLALAAAVVPVIAWKVLALWPGNRLAVKSNAAEA
jgi:tellurite resistance protein